MLSALKDVYILPFLFSGSNERLASLSIRREWRSYDGMAGVDDELAEADNLQTHVRAKRFEAFISQSTSVRFEDGSTRRVVHERSPVLLH
jgi:hypothetical protein